VSSGLQGRAPEDRPHPAGRRNKQGIRIDPETQAELQPRRTVMSVLVDHEPGVLARVSGLFSRRQFNIESLTVGPTVDDSLARITLVVEEPDPGIDQIEKQLEKLVCVHAVDELDSDATRRELALVKVDGTSPDEIHAITEIYGGYVVDASENTVTVELTGSRQKIEAAIDTFDGRFGIREIARTGAVALERGAEDTT
jgi:acetolactate synthase-1/3 small subunit